MKTIFAPSSFLSVSGVVTFLASTSTVAASAVTVESIQVGDSSNTNSNNQRQLNDRTCPFDSSLKTDSVYYEADVSLITKQDVDCDLEEWATIGSAVETFLGQTDLYSGGIGIIDLAPVVCDTTAPGLGAGRRRLENPLSGFAFLLSYFGNGECMFCFGDNGDSNTRRRIQETPANTPSLRSRRLSSCGGCHTIDFSKRGDGRAITSTMYVPTEEYWNSHGVKIVATGGYTPSDKARLYDTTYKANNNNDGDPDLGSPNRHCPGGGPGKGTGGRPTLDGEINPGANCDGEGYVLIIQEKNKSEADDNARGGRITFEFRYPVTLNSIGFMDMEENERNRDNVKIYYQDGTSTEHEGNGFGDNSIETLLFGYRKVIKVDVNFKGSGAIRFVDFCHDCGEEEAALAALVDGYYQPASVQSFENEESVSYFESKLSAINSKLSQEIGAKLRTAYYNDSSSCLYRKDVTSVVELRTSVPERASTCGP